MAAIIKTYLNGDPATVVEGLSRNDLRPGDVVTCEAKDPAPGGEYRWTLAFAPMADDGTTKSVATVQGQETNPQCSFTVDYEGAYLVRLIIDPGTVTESTQFVRLRFLTKFGALKLVAAGERRDGSGIIPVDATTEGWANDQNYNLQELLGHVARTAISSRVVYVDANRGEDPTNAQNTETAEDYADFWKIQDAIDHCVAGGMCGLPASVANPWIIIVRPGFYREALTVHPGLILMGAPEAGPETNECIIHTEDTDGTHTVSLPQAADESSIIGLRFENYDTAPTDGILHLTGSGKLTLKGCIVEQKGNAGTQGPCLSSAGPNIEVVDSFLRSDANTNAERFALTLSGGAAGGIIRSRIWGASGILTLAGGNLLVLQSSIVAVHSDADTAGIRSWGSLSVRETKIDVVVANDGWAIDINRDATGPTGVLLHAVHAELRPTTNATGGGIRFNTNFVDGSDGTVRLASVSLLPDRLVFDPASFVDDPAVQHLTSGESLGYWASKEVHTSSLNVGNLPADSVQQALDKLLNVAISVVTLDDAYDGLLDHSTDPPTRGSGAGSRIIADALDGFGVGIPVSIVDKAAPDGTAAAANTQGRLQVVSNVEVGAIDAPEINLDPNPFGVGPRLSFGKTVWPGGPHKASAIVQAASDPALQRHYHLRLQTQASNQTGPVWGIGAVVIQGGESFGLADGGEVHIRSGESWAGTAGSVFLAPAGNLVVAGPNSTPAVLTAANPCTNPVGITGDIVLATPAGPFTVSVDAADTPAQVATAITTAAAGAVFAIVAGGGELRLTTNVTGPFADVLYVSGTQGLEAALGDLTAAAVAFTDGAYGDTFLIQTTADNELSLGIGGAVGSMVFNADTGKLTVPGLIDPWGLIFSEVDHTAANEAGIHPTTGEGALFVSDGTGGLLDNHPHYRGEDNGAGVEQDPLAFVLSDGTGNATEVAFWSADGVLGGNPDLWWDNTNNRLGVGLSAPQNVLHVETANDTDGVIFGNTVDGSKLVSSYVAGSGMDLQLYDATNTQGVRLRPWANSWFLDTLSVGTATPVVGVDLTVDGNAQVGGDLTVVGDLTVQGDVTTMNTSTVTVEDKNIELGTVEAPGVPTDITADGGGITLLGDTDKTIIWDLATGAWHFNQSVEVLSASNQLKIGSSPTEYALLGVAGAGGLTIESVNGPFLVTSAGNLSLDAAANLNLNSQSNDAAHAINLGTENKPGPVNVGTVGTRDVTMGSITSTTAVYGASIGVDAQDGPLTMQAAGSISVDSSAALSLNTSSDTHAINLGTENKDGDVNIATAGTRDLNLGATTSNTTIQGDPITIDSAGRVTMDAAGYISVTSSAALKLETTSHTHDINLGAENKNSPINIGTGGTRTITMGNANSGVIINGPPTTTGKALTVNGDLDVTGIIDPTAVVITHTASAPDLEVGQSSLWMDAAGAVQFHKRTAVEDPAGGIADSLATTTDLAGVADPLPTVDGGDDGEVLTVVGGVWDKAPSAGGGGGGGASILNDLTDVDTTGMGTGDLLELGYAGGSNATFTAAGPGGTLAIEAMIPGTFPNMWAVNFVDSGVSGLDTGEISVVWDMGPPPATFALTFTGPFSEFPATSGVTVTGDDFANAPVVDGSANPINPAPFDFTGTTGDSFTGTPSNGAFAGGSDPVLTWMPSSDFTYIPDQINNILTDLGTMKWGGTINSYAFVGGWANDASSPSSYLTIHATNNGSSMNPMVQAPERDGEEFIWDAAASTPGQPVLITGTPDGLGGFTPPWTISYTTAATMFDFRDALLGQTPGWGYDHGLSGDGNLLIDGSAFVGGSHMLANGSWHWNREHLPNIDQVNDPSDDEGKVLVVNNGGWAARGLDLGGLRNVRTDIMAYYELSDVDGNGTGVRFVYLGETGSAGNGQNLVVQQLGASGPITVDWSGDPQVLTISYFPGDAQSTLANLMQAVMAATATDPNRDVIPPFDWVVNGMGGDGSEIMTQHSGGPGTVSYLLGGGQDQPPDSTTLSFTSMPNGPGLWALEMDQGGGGGGNVQNLSDLNDVDITNGASVEAQNLNGNGDSIQFYAGSGSEHNGTEVVLVENASNNAAIQYNWDTSASPNVLTITYSTDGAGNGTTSLTDIVQDIQQGNGGLPSPGNPFWAEDNGSQGNLEQGAGTYTLGGGQDQPNSGSVLTFDGNSGSWFADNSGGQGGGGGGNLEDLNNVQSNDISAAVEANNLDTGNTSGIKVYAGPGDTYNGAELVLVQLGAAGATTYDWDDQANPVALTIEFFPGTDTLADVVQAIRNTQQSNGWPLWADEINGGNGETLDQGAGTYTFSGGQNHPSAGAFLKTDGSGNWYTDSNAGSGGWLNDLQDVTGLPSPPAGPLGPGEILVTNASGNFTTSNDSDRRVENLWAENIDFVGTLTMQGHIVPDENAYYDIGSIDSRIRDLYLSENSLWLGDGHRLSITQDSSGNRVQRRRGPYEDPSTFVPQGLDYRMALYMAEPSCPLADPTVNGDMPNSAVLSSVGATGTPPVYANQSTAVQEAWRTALVWFVAAAIENNNPGWYFDNGNNVADRTQWRLRDWWAVVEYMSHLPDRTSGDEFIGAHSIDHWSWPPNISSDGTPGLWFGPLPQSAYTANPGYSFQPSDQVVRNISDMFSDDDFEDPEIVPMETGGSDTTYMVERGDNYVGFNTVSAGAVVNVWLPTDEPDGAIMGRKVTIMNESTTTSGGDIVRIQAGDGATQLAGAVSGEDYWEVPLMTAMTLICDGASPTSWFIISTS
jgi:hypothetical protein